MPDWERVDLADVGVELQARNHAVRVLLAAQPDCGGTWTGYYDALFFSGTGVSGPTRRMPSRQGACSAPRLTKSPGIAHGCSALHRVPPCQPPSGNPKLFAGSSS